MSERTIPILPCRSIDDTLAFYEAIGFQVTYRQERPNTAAVVARGDIELQFFVLKALDPANSYSTCYVLTSDVDALYAAFTAGLRSALGRLPTRGVPRIGPLREMSYGVRQFVMVDPGGNYIRVGQPVEQRSAPRADTASRLERALVAAVTLADSKGDDLASARVLDSAFAADPPVAGPVAVRALVLRADVAHRLGESDRARDWLADADRIDLDATDRAAVDDELRRARELAEVLGPRGAA